MIAESLTCIFKTGCAYSLIYDVVIVLGHKGISMARLTKCKATLKFPWSGGSMEAEMLRPEVLAAVDVFQRRQRVAEELDILHKERAKLAENAIKQCNMSEGDHASWLTNYLANACDAYIMTEQDFDDMFFDEPQIESDVEED
jgi:hypothetical protein